MSTNGRNNICSVCGIIGTHLCGRCKSSRYCSDECQADDWPVHKLLCKSFSSFDLTARPSYNHFRGVVFPQDQAKPQVEWIQRSNLEQILGPGMIQTSQIQTDAVLQRSLPDNIDLCYRESLEWCGPIVAVGVVRSDGGQLRDLDMNDFRYIADFLISYGRFSFSNPASPIALNTKVVKGVRINCVGAQEAFNKPHFEPVDIPTTHSIFDPSRNSTSDVAGRIGLPILTQRCGVSLPSARERKHRGTGNPDATFLHQCCDPTTAIGNPMTENCFGWVEWQWQSNAGSIFVVRQDGKPLAPAHVEALCRYCKDEVSDLMAHAISPDRTPMTRESILANICRPMFSMFWDKFLDEKREEGGNATDPSPYDI